MTQMELILEQKIRSKRVHVVEERCAVVREGLPLVIRAVFWGIILSMARLIRAVGYDLIG
jgi:hypothetical protein